MSTFVAYNSSDLPIVWQLVTDLETMYDTADLWFAPRHLAPGASVSRSIVLQIQQCTTFLYCVGTSLPTTLDSDRSDPILGKELEIAARMAETQSDFRLLSVRLLQSGSLPEPFGNRVTVDISSAGKRTSGLEKLAELLRVQ